MHWWNKNLEFLDCWKEADGSYDSRVAHDCCWMSRREEAHIDLFSFRWLPEVWNQPGPSGVTDSVIVFSCAPSHFRWCFHCMSAPRKGNREKGDWWQEVPKAFKRCSLNLGQGMGAGKPAPSQSTCEFPIILSTGIWTPASLDASLPAGSCYNRKNNWKHGSSCVDSSKTQCSHFRDGGEN